MSDINLVNKWIEKADEDFGFASISLADELEFFAQICFHFHQAAEKYLKAFIVLHDLDFRKIHDLLELLEICAKRSSSLRNLKDDCAYLNRFYISTRYPVHWSSSFIKEDAVGAMKAAKNISKKIKSMVKK